MIVSYTKSRPISNYQYLYPWPGLAEATASDILTCATHRGEAKVEEQGGGGRGRGQGDIPVPERALCRSRSVDIMSRRQAFNSRYAP